MFFYEGKSCPVCQTPFRETDDIVTCPVCGAPHHRSCWQRDGHCHFESDHGTPNQWPGQQPQPNAASGATDSASAANRCPNCGTVNLEHAEFCQRCGRPLRVTEWRSPFSANVPPNGTPCNEYSPFRVAFDPLGGVNRNETFDDEGTTAEELAMCVGNNTMYYLPRFQRIKNGHAVQWNWAAFFIAPYWLLFRKQYPLGIFTCLFYLLYDLLVILSGASSALTYEQMETAVQSWCFPAVVLMSVGVILVSLLFGLFGTKLYYHLCLKRVRQAKQAQPADLRAELRRKGGVSFVWGAVAYFSIQFLSAALSSFLTL